MRVMATRSDFQNFNITKVRGTSSLIRICEQWTDTLTVIYMTMKQNWKKSQTTIIFIWIINCISAL